MNLCLGSRHGGLRVYIYCAVKRGWTQQYPIPSKLSLYPALIPSAQVITPPPTSPFIPLTRVTKKWHLWAFWENSWKKNNTSKNVLQEEENTKTQAGNRTLISFQASAEINWFQFQAVPDDPSVNPAHPSQIWWGSFCIKIVVVQK